MATWASIDDYLTSLPREQRAVVEEIARRVAAWKQHVSVYPVPPAGDLALDADLAPYAGAKGTLRLPYAQVDHDLVERVVRRLLESR